LSAIALGVAEEEALLSGRSAVKKQGCLKEVKNEAFFTYQIQIETYPALSCEITGTKKPSNKLG